MTLTQFADLFRGSLAAYGTEAGGCDRSQDPSEAEFLRRVEAHLFGNEPMGVYPQYNRPCLSSTAVETVCGWGCIDFDEGEDDSFIYAFNSRNVLAEFGIESWIERSRSKGYHLWIFPAEHVPAAIMRRALLVAAGIAGAPDREINPKQERLTISESGVASLGNYVRLPYPRDWEATGRRCVIDDLGSPVPLQHFLTKAHSHRTPTANLEALAALWVAPKPPKPAPLLEAEPSGTLPGLIRHMVANGPLDDVADRSAWLWRLCKVMYEKAVPYADARAALLEADARWGKFHLRTDGESELDRMLAKAWGLR